MPEQQSIKDTLDVIRKALEDEESSLEEIKENVLILNKLVKDDGTIDLIEDNSLTKSEIKDILDNKLEELFDQHFEKWLNNKLPTHLEKFFNKKQSN